MLQSFYNHFGFFGALAITMGFFILLIFWVAAIAGINELPESANKKWKLLAAVLIPPYPILWIITDMVQQHRRMNKE